MKKISVLLSLVLIVSLLSGCAKSKNDDKNLRKENSDSVTASEDNKDNSSSYEENDYAEDITENFDEEDVINIALFGVDTPVPDLSAGNGDAAIVLSLNTKTKTTKLISVMHDTLVPIEISGNRYCDTIGFAYLNSKEIAINSLNEAFDLNIEDFIAANHFKMIDIVDILGGIDATITDDELDSINGNLNINDYIDVMCSEEGLNPNDYYIKESGKQTLNGVQAVAYSQVEHGESVWGTNYGFGRADRQLHVVQEIVMKVKSTSPENYNNLAESLLACTMTSISVSEMTEYMTEMLGTTSSLEKYSIPQQEMTFAYTGPAVGVGAFVYYDLDYAAKMINAIIYDNVTQADFIKENPIEKNDWYSETDWDET